MTNREDGLALDSEILDWLELLNSTVECAQLLGISQSSCSRRYRSISDRFGLDFDRAGHSYRATKNLDVLACLRQAGQKMRVRQGRIRFCLGWQLGRLDPGDFSAHGAPVPIRPMDSWRLLTLLEQRLLDLAVVGLQEFQGLLETDLARLRYKRMPLGGRLLCIPLCRWELRLLARHDHPLHGRRTLTPDDLSQYPSPALSMGMAPRLMGALQSQGLASHPCGLMEYGEERWEGFAADGIGLSYAAPHQLMSLQARYALQPLEYPLGIQECLGVVGHRDVLGDACFQDGFRPLLQQLRAVLLPLGCGLHWLC